MRTRYIPAGIMLLAGVITCLISIVQEKETISSLTTLLIVLIVFYILGLLVKFAVEKILVSFKEKEDKETSLSDIEQEDQDTLQSTQSQEQENDL